MLGVFFKYFSIKKSRSIKIITKTLSYDKVEKSSKRRSPVNIEVQLTTQ